MMRFHQKVLPAVAIGHSLCAGEKGKIRKKRGVQKGRVGVRCSPGRGFSSSKKSRPSDPNRPETEKGAQRYRSKPGGQEEPLFRSPGIARDHRRGHEIRAPQEETKNFCAR